MVFSSVSILHNSFIENYRFYFSTSKLADAIMKIVQGGEERHQKRGNKQQATGNRQKEGRGRSFSVRELFNEARCTGVGMRFIASVFLGNNGNRQKEDLV
jgi:hypothetical protein